MSTSPCQSAICPCPVLNAILGARAPQPAPQEPGSAVGLLLDFCCSASECIAQSKEALSFCPFPIAIGAARFSDRRFRCTWSIRKSDTAIEVGQKIMKSLCLEVRLGKWKASNPFPPIVQVALKFNSRDGQPIAPTLSLLAGLALAYRLGMIAGLTSSLGINLDYPR